MIRDNLHLDHVSTAVFPLACLSHNYANCTSLQANTKAAKPKQGSTKKRGKAAARALDDFDDFETHAVARSSSKCDTGNEAGLLGGRSRRAPKVPLKLCD